MSHATVMVIRNAKSKSLEDLMAPYDENLEIAPYIYRTKQEIIVDYFERAKKYMNNEDSYIQKYLKDPTNEKYSKERIKVIKKDIQTYTKVLKGLFSDKELYKLALKEEGIDKNHLDADGNELSTYNPNSKWDWYQIGGRWSGSLIEKIGKSTCPTDEAIARNIDWKKTGKHSCGISTSVLKEFWKYYVEGEPMDEKKASKEVQELIKEEFYNKEYFKRRYHDAKTYVKHMTQFTTYAVITPDGVWHEPGRMGWFGCSLAEGDSEFEFADTFYEKFIATLKGDEYITIVDYHI